MQPSLPQRGIEWLIAQHPTPFVTQYGPDMIETFRARADDARRRGRWRVAAFFLREGAALTRSVVLEAARARHAGMPGGSQVLAHLLRESRHAVRRLAGAPGFTGAAVFTLALAIGATAAVFTLLHRIVLAPLPYPAASRLVALDHAAPGVGLASDVGMSIGLYREYAKLPSIDAIAIYYVGDGTLTGQGEAAIAEFLHTTPSLGNVLGIRPVLGRWFVDEEGVTGARKVIVLTHGFWQRRFGASPGAIGKSLRVDGVAHEIIGVLPAGLAFPDPRVDFVMALPLDPVTTRAAGFNFQGLARLAAGVDVEAARADQNAVIADLANRFPSDTNAVNGLLASSRLASLVQPYKERLLGDMTQTLWVVLGACAVVLLMACANIANLFLVRAEGRSREVTLRRALGAGRWSIAAYYLVEAQLVALASGAAGLLLAYAAVEALVRSGLATLPRLHEVRIDADVIGFTVLASVVSGAMFGMLPILHCRLTSGGSGRLHQSQRATTATRHAARLRHALMAAQVALALVLLTSAGLMVRSFTNLLRVDPGFRAESRLVFKLGLPRSEAPTRAAAAQRHEAILERLRGLHGVRSVAVVSTLPLEGEGHQDPIAVQNVPQVAGAAQPVVGFRRVSKGYFDAMGIPLREGRFFDGADAAGRTDAVIVDEALARVYFPDARVLGRRIRPLANDPDRWLTIVGVVGNTATTSLHETTPSAKLYVPLSGSMWADVPSPHTVSYVLHTMERPLASVPAVRQVLLEMSPNVAMAGVERLEDAVARTRADRSFAMILLVMAAAVALALGLVGVYAVISHGVSQRRMEIAVRLTVGATPADLTRLIVGQAGRSVVVGVLIGAGAAMGAARLLRTLLFGVTPADPLTHGSIVAALLMIAMLACWLPARRASRVSPIEGLRGMP